MKLARPTALLLITLPWLLLGDVVAAQELDALRQIEVELLAKRFADYEEANTRERDASRALRETLERLNGLIGDRSAGVEALRRLEAEVSLAREAAYLRARETTDLRLELYGRMERIEALDQVLGIGAGVLSGTWSFDLGPDDGAGTLTFRTYGERVEGSYQMADGRRGTLLGSLVDGRLELERIDTVDGRDRKLEGRLSQDGRRLTGSWQLFELASGRRTQGGWDARKLNRP
ncbi:MAG TPA: hypothetical protein VMV46_17465 [Thermoanaerobaculia bacterium]|nr:hypothetical protein [Thermoanaerobaculia bacterium]